MARSLWRGSLSFGLVNVPVALVSAVRDLDVHFNQLHADNGARLEVKRICKKGGHEVPYEEIGYGYELDSGKHKGKEVVLTQEELDAAQPEKTRTIDIDEFVDVADIDPVLFDHPYFLTPDETTTLPPICAPSRSGLMAEVCVVLRLRCRCVSCGVCVRV